MTNEEIEQCLNTIVKNEKECHIFKALNEYISFMRNCDSDNVIETSLIYQIIKSVEKLGDKQKEREKI